MNTTEDANVDLQKDGKYFVPAWSISVLAGCNMEIYNTAKVLKLRIDQLFVQLILFHAYLVIYIG